MELTAIVKALQNYTKPTAITLFADDRTIITIAHDKKQMALRTNPEFTKKGRFSALWKAFYTLYEFHNVQLCYVKGHSGNKFNCMVDKQARKTANEKLKENNDETQNN